MREKTYLIVVSSLPKCTEESFNAKLLILLWLNSLNESSLDIDKNL